MLMESMSDECVLITNRKGILTKRPKGHPVSFNEHGEGRKNRLFENTFTAEKDPLRNRFRNACVVVKNEQRVVPIRGVARKL